MIPNFDEMTVKDLKEFAEENNIDLGDAKKKADIQAILKSIYNVKDESEENEMTEVNENVVNEEVVEGAEKAKDKKVFHLDDGSECSRSAYIRQEFAKDRSRKDIKEELGVEYYVVYAATANMYNAVHQEGATSVAGKGSVLVPKVNANFEYVDANDVIIEADENGEISQDSLVMVPRADLMRTLAVAGKTRNELKDYFGVPYATVYAATKDEFQGSTRGNKTVTLEDGTEVNRVDLIREMFAKGKSRRDIAKELTIMTGELVDYSTVWAATKPEKEEDVVSEVAEATEATYEDSVDSEDSVE